ncbi:histidine kinase [Verrucomicrobia bacterium IMCC26134]|nr:histidine kinase [Verrucomicrobia bacterium IMCC26134]
MKSKRKPAPARATPARELAAVRTRLAETEQTLRAIRNGEVDTVLVAGKQGSHIFTLNGAAHTYRMLIETMNEGALTLASDHTILFTNQCFARLVKTPLEQVTGTSFRRFLSPADLSALRTLLKRSAMADHKIQVRLITGDAASVPAQISIHRLVDPGSALVTLGMVVTDMTEARRNEERLRALANRVAEVQEAERGRVALDLHDNITQMLCAVLFRSQTLAVSLAGYEGPTREEALALREMISRTSTDVERISRNLRPGVLEFLGLAAALEGTCTEFARRTGIRLRLTCDTLNTRLSAEAELVLYRILQEALQNIERHARASHVIVRLNGSPDGVRLSIQDDGVGFDPALPSLRRRGMIDLGLLGMRERANHVGGTFQIKTAPRAGTKIVTRIPFQPPV